MWKITESVDQLLYRIRLSDDGKREIEGISHPIKKRERLASRCCVQKLVEQFDLEYNGIIKDSHDKPHLIGINHHISISHSFPYAVGILHKKLRVGIDIEKPLEKIGRIAHRFLNDEEFADSNGDIKKLCVYWSGKEAIFKLNGKMGLNFKRDIRISPFDFHQQDVIRSEFAVGEDVARIALNYQEVNDHIICYCF